MIKCCLFFAKQERGHDSHYWSKEEDPATISNICNEPSVNELSIDFIKKCSEKCEEEYFK